MTHNYTAQEVSAICGLSYSTIHKHIKQGALKPSGKQPCKGGGRYIFAEDEIERYAAKIGIDPIWERSGRAYTPAEPKEEPKPEPKSHEVISEFVVIRLGEYWLKDKLSLSKDMNNAKKYAPEALDAAHEQCDGVGGKLIIVRTELVEVE